MAVASYDGSFSAKQDAIARLGREKATAHKKMSKEEWANFQHSPFMEALVQTEEILREFTDKRDKKRKETDPTFDPQSSDFSAPRAHKFDKSIDYYTVLGTDEYATQDEVKKAYKQLSLIYHPDKTHGKSQAEKDESAQIFLELKAAYRTLSDNPTRRQFDKDRDHRQAQKEVTGAESPDRPHFDGTEVRKRIEENKLLPSETIDIPIKCRLEKFIYGGHKSVRRKRQVKKGNTFNEENLAFRIHVPPDEEEPFSVLFKKKGDQHLDRKADNLRFIVESKPNELVKREDQDLVVKETVSMPVNADSEYFFCADLPYLRGKHLILWGSNPFFRNTGTGTGTLRAQVKGAGLGAKGSLRFQARFTGGDLNAAPPTMSKTEWMVEGRKKEEDWNFGKKERDEWALRNHKRKEREYHFYMHWGEVWEVIGGADSNGLKVRKGHQTSSPEEAERISHGALVKKLELEGERLHYHRLTGTGPETGWVSIKLKDKVLLTPTDKRPQVDMGGPRDPWEEHIEKDGKEVKFTFHDGAVKDDGNFYHIASMWMTLEEAKLLVVDHPDCLGFCYQGRAREGQHEFHFKRKYENWGEFLEEGWKWTCCEVEHLSKDKGGAQTKETPAGAPRPPGSHGMGGLAAAPAMRRKMSRWQEWEPACSLELEQVGSPVTLFTKPSCTLTLYANSKQLQQFEAPGPGHVTAGNVFAINISSSACSRGRAGHDWNLLRTRLVPLLECTGFILLRASVNIMPKQIANAGAWEWLPDIEIEEPPVPWKEMGDRAFKQNYYWLALTFYSRCLEALDAEESSSEDVLKSRVLSNRAACFASLNDFQMSLQDARRATTLAPTWAKPWSRVGLAATKCGLDCEAESEDYIAYHWEANAAFSQSVELEPSTQNVTDLRDAAARVERVSIPAAEDAKEKGNMAMRTSEFGQAVAMYTLAIARLPPEPETTEVSRAETELAEEKEAEEMPDVLTDQHATMRAHYFSNRCAAFLRLRNWSAAESDGKKAVACQADLVNARCHLGAALIGSMQYEEAYVEFARALQHAEHSRIGRIGEEEDGKTRVRAPEEETPEEERARKGRDTCLQEMLLWHSKTAKKRFKERFVLDLYRPSGSSKIFAVSDLHIDKGDNEDWAHLIDDVKFQDDVLIVAGDMADTVADVIKGLTILKSKFRRVFYTVGHHDMWIDSSEVALYPDSISKLHAIFKACDELEVDVSPAPVTEDVFIVPLLSWYNADFDENDPFPDPRATWDSACKWPMDRHESLWRYMLKLNEAHFKMTYHGTVLTFSHFLPGHWCWHDPPISGLKKAVGCEDIDDQLRQVRSQLHVFGHTHHKYTGAHKGVQYVQNPLGFPNERHTNKEPLMLVFDGSNACMREWAIDGTPPPGFVKKVQHVAAFKMERLLNNKRKLSEIDAVIESFNKLPGIKSMFKQIGSNKKDIGGLAQEMEWWDLPGMTLGTTHALIVIADGLKEYKGWLHSKAHKREWSKATEGLIDFTISCDCQLGMDLVRPTSQKDPLVSCTFMRLNTEHVSEGSELWGHLQHFLGEFQQIPGIKACLQPVGYGAFSWQEWLDEVWVKDESYGATYMLTVVANNTLCFKRWRHSEQFNGFAEVLGHAYIHEHGMAPLLFFPMPMEISTSC